MTRILFVDDEPQVLDGIRGMLRKQRDSWQMDFAQSGSEALSLFESHKYDLVCSDMRMPGMDGAQLLTQVSDRWPETVRIVLSGYSELEQTIRLVPIAHQYVCKPCNAQQLCTVIERCLKVRDILQRKSLREIVGRIKSLPALPGTYARLRAALADPNVSVGSVSKIVAEDMAITAKLLQVANSAFFRLARKVTKVDQAVSHLGFGTVSNLVLSMEIFSQWPKTSVSGFDLKKMQSDALVTAALSREVANRTPYVDDALLTGLLHDIGYIILLKECPGSLQEARRLSQERRISLHAAEQEVFGSSHAEIGAYLLAIWGLPYNVVDAVAHHHESLAHMHNGLDLVAITAVANILADEDLVPGSDTYLALSEFLKSAQAPFDAEALIETSRTVKNTGAGTT